MWEWISGLIWLMGILAVTGTVLGPDERENFMPLMRLAVLLYILKLISLLPGS
ncbi:hypothetical protein [Bhargavaea cecembensis]|uniref:hypothetical protein n=1 Tax=Bhargavaea cecembensis TaxID=394098 RepID=UPI0012E93CAC|nr:hypothetical protein [Bhargavaea cecembensis]